MYIFSSDQYDYLKKKIMKHDISLKSGKLDSKNFPDGESYTRIIDPKKLKQKNCLIIAGNDDKDILFIVELANTLIRIGIKSLHILIPFYSYSTQEREVIEGEFVRAKTRAKILSAIPAAHFGNTFYFFDLHTGGIPYYMEGQHQVEHIYGKKLIQKALEKIKIKEKNIVLVAPDAGRAKWVESLAKEFKLEADFILKNRDGLKISTAAHNLNNLKDKSVIIYDDMIRSGSSILNAAKLCHQQGAKNIYLISSHAVFCDPAPTNIINTEYVKQVYVSNSHPNSQIKNKKIKVLDMTKVVLKNLYDNLLGENQ